MTTAWTVFVSKYTNYVGSTITWLPGVQYDVRKNKDKDRTKAHMFFSAFLCPGLHTTSLSDPHSANEIANNLLQKQTFPGWLRCGRKCCYRRHQWQWLKCQYGRWTSDMYFSWRVWCKQRQNNKTCLLYWWLLQCRLWFNYKNTHWLNYDLFCTVETGMCWRDASGVWYYSLPLIHLLCFSVGRCKQLEETFQ